MTGEPQLAGEPQLLSEGHYAIYQEPGGGAVLVYRPDGASGELRLPIPAGIWQLARQVAEGVPITPAHALKAIWGGMR